ncbi:MAG: HD domain-containing phosphohydrolase [Vampirovibrionales bacterium]|nr:HD domain-containing phosphohydrolase [Vampirovibrionales bacterium]
MSKTAVHTPKILLVDDEPHILQALQRLIRPLLYDVTITQSPAHACQLATEQEFAVVISDYKMPDMTGTEVLRSIKACSPDTVRMLLTGYADATAAQEAINDGAVYRFLNKPWQNDDLAVVIKQAVAQYRLMKENQRLQEVIHKRNDTLRQLNQILGQKVMRRTAEITALNQKLEASLMGAIKVLAQVSDARYGHDAQGGHAQRVSNLCKAFGQRMGMEPARLQQLEIAALLHDIGKMLVSSDFISKPEHLLTPVERLKQKQHVTLGQDLLGSIPGLEAVAGWVRHHHESFDGLGYPDRLFGHKIPLESRIIALADAYDNALNRSSASSAAVRISTSGAYQTIQQQAGKQFDPELVTMLSEILQAEMTKNNAARPGVIEILGQGLCSGMRLAEDLISDQGVLLLPKETLLNEESLMQLKRTLAKTPMHQGIFVYQAAT